MSDALPKHGPYEFWQAPQRPSSLEPMAVVRPRPGEVCTRCQSEFVMGARFCHVCGALRSAPSSSAWLRLQRALEFGQLRQRLGLGMASFVAFLAGFVCVLAALATGLLFTASTVLDWQAVQLWRLQWLLAAAVAFLAAILLKR